jgi:hypothetical protein
VTAPNPNSSNDFTLVVAPLTAALAVVALGPIGLVAAAVPWLAAWYAGSLFICVVFTAVSAVLTAVLAFDGRLATGALTVWDGLSAPMLALDLETTVVAWLRLAIDQQVTICVIPVGLGAGAIVRLLLEDSRNSGLGRLVRRKPRRGVGARSASRRLASQPSSDGDRTLLGTDWSRGTPVYISDAELNNHVMVVGTTGRGKTITAMNLVEAHIERGSSVLFLDGKGDVNAGRQIKGFAESLGRTAYLFHAQAGGDSCAYNPFVSSDFSALADMVVTLHEWSEPYYRVLAVGYMQTVCKVALAIGEPVDLISIEKLMSVGEMLKAVRKHRKVIPNAEALIEEITDQQAAEEAGIESLRGLIRNLGRSSAAPLFDTRGDRPVIRLTDARREGAVVYFALPALRFPELSKAIGTLVINDARLTLSENGPWLIVMDEISTFAGPQILNLINQGRGFGARVVLAGQSFADLERSVADGGESFASQLLASINSLIVHQLNSPADAELAAEYAGTTEKMEVTAQVVEQTATGVGSARSTREFIVSPDDFKELGTAEAFFISKKSGRRTKIASRLSRIAQVDLSAPAAKTARMQRPVSRSGGNTPA